MDVARRDLYKGGAQARRLLADTHLSTVVTQSTMKLDETDQVKRACAQEDFKLGVLEVREGEVFWFVASKFSGLYYIAVERDGVWLCSASDERAASAMVAKVKAHRYLPA